MDTATKTEIDAAKNTSKRIIQKTAEGKPKENKKRKEIEEIYIPPEKGQQIIDDFRLF